jgi:hypothetical protein
MRALILAATIVGMATAAQAQTLRVVPQAGYTDAAAAAQTVPEYTLGTPLRLIWDYTDAQIPQATSFQVQIDANAAVPAGAPVLGVNTYQHNLLSAQLTLGTHTISALACNEEGCAPATTQVRIRRTIPSPPGNPRVSPQQQAFMAQPVPMNRAADIAIKYLDVAYNVQLNPAQLGIVAQFHPLTPPTPWSVIQAADRAAEAFMPAVPR